MRVERAMQRLTDFEARARWRAAANHAEMMAALAEVKRIRISDKRLQATRTLVVAGMKTLMKLTHGRAADLKRFEHRMSALMVAQRRTEDSLNRFITSLHRARPDGHDRPSRRS